ncbi:hypothetical protein K466DRAFT_666610 [Polyporus arcularius HHB13444]|uniref:Uncharacterized protein n=1 Tax=Polyporus arcularius HHB13444 TaxID=1314778 RepID=A0A5C3NXY2_9APHY|nr:hypothetical protein K466DRAFT_666610 [Polyporus arcularius HHB13444]
MSEDEHKPTAQSDSDESEDLDSNRTSTIAPAPFNNPAADVVLRSSDGTEFYVFGWILRETSPVFADMLVIPQPQAPETASHPLDKELVKPPVVDLTESRTTLELLLRLCYPSPTAPTFSSFDDAKPLLDAAHKYDLAFAGSMLEHAIAPFIRDKPIQVYAFAARLHLTDIMEATARASLALPLLWPYTPELEDISAGAYHRLLDYRERCKKALATLSNTKWPTSEHKWTWRACTGCVEHYSSRHQENGSCGKCGEASWFSSFWDDLMARLKERPSPTTLQDPALSDAPALKKALECSTCQGLVHEHIRKFLRMLAGEAEMKISKIRLEIK